MQDSRLRSFNKYFQQSMSASNINWKRVEELRVIGSNTNADVHYYNMVTYQLLQRLI